MTCPTDFVGALPRLTVKIPNLSGCLRCGKTGKFRALPKYLDADPVYLSAHSGTRKFSDMATPQVVALFDDADYGFVTATDTGTGLGGGVDRGAVYKKSTHDLVGTLFQGSNGTLKFRELSVLEPDLLTPLASGVAMSAHRNEVAFFDAQSHMNLSLLAMRTVSLDTGVSDRTTLRMIETELAGPVVSAAYRDLDDSYFILSRGGGEVRLHRVGPTLGVEHVATWSDGGTATDADLESSEEGLLAVTSRSANGFAVVVLAVGENPWQYSVVSYVSGSEPLGIGASITPEGLSLDRPGEHTDRVVPFIQVEEPGITYHPIGGSGWTTIFQ